jgi:DNA gyrase subunit A
MQNDIIKELSTNFIEYAVAVNTDRAIPDARSGLKPVAKRILWSAYEEGRLSSKPHVKAARIVGDVMGKYHPHGDSSIYLAMVRLSQSWVLRYPLIDFHGSNGTIGGDGPAAARYTEARLAKIAEDGLLKNIKKRNVDFISNYDETLEEPATLPAIFPNLLCNPNEGIGVAMACKWAPHNLVEVAQAINDYIDGKEPMLPGPDFPTGGTVINKSDIPAIMKTGCGTVKIRGKYQIEKNKIIFYEIPYGETIENLLEEIGKVCDTKEIEGILDAHDESNKKGVRIVIECAKNVDPISVVNKLFAKTHLQSSFSYNQVALVNKVPTELNLKQAIEVYINHNIDCLIKEITTKLQEAKDRAEVVAGLIKAIEDIDNIIKLIKNSNDSAEAKEKLISLGFSERQAKAILAMKLSSLTKLDGIELNKEAKELKNTINYLTTILNSKDEQIKIIKERLAEIVKKYGDARRTELLDVVIPKKEKEERIIPNEENVVVINKSGDVKRIPKANFKVQKRNTKGVKNYDGVILTSSAANTIDNVMVFTNFGKAYKMSVYDLPEGTNASKGTNFNSIFEFAPGEKVKAATIIPSRTGAKYVCFVTKNGLIKKTTLEEYSNCANRKKGIAAIKIKEGDSIADVLLIDEEEIVVGTKCGQGLRFTTNDIRPIGRITSGIKGAKLNEGDEVVSARVVVPESKLAIMTTDGYCKKIEVSEIPISNKNTKGVAITNKTALAGLDFVKDDDMILIMGDKSSVCISSNEIPEHSRTTKGSILIKGNECVYSITRV